MPTKGYTDSRDVVDVITRGYTEGFKQFDTDRNPLYMKFRKNLYGHTAEGRQIWSVTGQHSYTKGSKEQGWECIRTRMDPWLFIITCVYDELI